MGKFCHWQDSDIWDICLRLEKMSPRPQPFFGTCGLWVVQTFRQQTFRRHILHSKIKMFKISKSPKWPKFSFFSLLSETRCFDCFEFYFLSFGEIKAGKFKSNKIVFNPGEMKKAMKKTKPSSQPQSQPSTTTNSSNHPQPKPVESRSRFGEPEDRR